MILDDVQRLTLIQLYEIRKSLSTDSREIQSFDSIIESIRNGYECDTDGLDHLSSPMSEDDKKLVMDILDMFLVLRRWEKKTPTRDRNMAFEGFDGNNEGLYIGYAMIGFSKQDRWPDLAYAGRCANSHWPVIPRYKRMLDIWTTITDRYEPTQSDIDVILAASHKLDRNGQ